VRRHHARKPAWANQIAQHVCHFAISDAAAPMLAAGFETALNSTSDVDRELRDDHRGDDTEG
jgi:hypothetical protein